MSNYILKAFLLLTRPLFGLTTSVLHVGNTCNTEVVTQDKGVVDLGGHIKVVSFS